VIDLERLKTVQVKVPEKLYNEIQGRIEIGIYVDQSEVLKEALKKMFAEESREFLREIVKRKRITKKEMLKEWKKIRESA
jgi:Arc/MetJ-type ribon-helix-helix transcriptional regulator